MIWFPQLEGGAIAQFPAERSRRWRTVVNQLEDGTRVFVPDSLAGRIGWNLGYQDLSDLEAQKLADLFTATRGCYGSFTFVDPFANLMIWSEDLSQPCWQTGLLQVAPIATVPGGYRTWSLQNSAMAVQSLQQTVGVSGDYLCCFSVYVRSTANGEITLLRDSVASSITVGTNWKRVSLSSKGTPGAASSIFSLQLEIGQAIQIWGLQLEVQPFASAYKENSTLTGIYDDTSFSSDELITQSDGPGRTSCSITLTSRI